MFYFLHIFEIDLTFLIDEVIADGLFEIGLCHHKVIDSL